MVRILKETNNTSAHKYKYTFDIQCGCQCDEEYEDGYIEYEIDLDNPDLKDLNQWYISVSQQLEPPTRLYIESVDVYEAEFTNNTDPDSGIVKAKMELSSDTKLNPDDYEYICEALCEYLETDARVSISGSVEATVDGFDPFTPYGHTEHTETYELDNELGSLDIDSSTLKYTVTQN